VNARLGESSLSNRLLNLGAAGPIAALAALDSDALLLVGLRGVIRSADGGETFASVQDQDVRGKLVNAVDTAPGTVVAFGSRVAALSIDRGRSWSRIRLPRRRAIRDLDFATSGIGMLARHARGSRAHSRRWPVVAGLPTLGTSRGRSFELADARNGYVVVNQFGRFAQVVLRTSDGGRSWHPQLVGKAGLDAFESGGSADYALSAAAARSTRRPFAATRGRPRR
jgi:photosystem II stability/assembly factor-like uncharacterized protein